MAAAVKSSRTTDSLEHKFFELVVQPSQATEDVKPKGLPDKNAPKPEKKRRPVHRAKSVEPLKKSAVTQSSALVANSSTSLSSSLLPLRILLTPNPSATILQCTVLREVKDAEHNRLLLKQLSKVEQKLDDAHSSDQKEDEEKAFTVPQIFELGLVGVFELIRETVSEHKGLCCKALRALLNMLQGQKLEGMKNEPDHILENLFQTLLDLSRLPTDHDVPPSDEYTQIISDTSLPGIGPLKDDVDVTNSVPALASSCLLSLVFAWGNTSKLLAVVTSFIADCSNQKRPLFVQLPSSFAELQRMVTAALLGKDHIPMMYQAGVGKSSMLKTWPIKAIDTDCHVMSVKCDGSYLYCLLQDGQLLKIGTGYNATVEGLVYNRRSIFSLEGCSKLSSGEPNQLFYCEGSLYLLNDRASLYSIDRDSLSEKFICKLPPLEGVWFSDDDGLGCLAPQPQEDSYSMYLYKVDSGKVVAKRTPLKIQPTRKHLDFHGNCPGFFPIDEEAPSNVADVVQACVGHDFSLSRTGSGSVLFAGRSDSLGLTKGKNKVFELPEPLPLPGGAKISHISVAPDGGHGIMISESGQAYFVGTSKRGEDGETSKSRRQPTPQKPKLMKCMEGKVVSTGCCNAGTSAFVTKDGKLYLFGKDSTQADSKTGLVSSLSDVHVKQVALGKAHVIVLSADGRIWTAGVNNKGQCGRQEGVVTIAQRIAEVEQERDVSMPEDKSVDGPRVTDDGSASASIAPICSPDKHKWRKEVCMVCAVCCECTGYGSSCINSALDGRYPGTPCGCGAGESGCVECGCCKTCAGEADISKEEKKKVTDNRVPYDPTYLPPALDQPPSILKRLAALYQRGKKKGASAVIKESSKGSLNKTDVLQEANKMALLPLVQIPFDTWAGQPVEVTCGSHHTIVRTDTGSIFGFGQNTHGELGLGDTKNRNTVSWIPTPEKIAQIAAGSHHTVLLSVNGIVYGCGSNNVHQLGELPSGNANVLTPMPILDFQRSSLKSCPRASWISACHTFSFTEYEEVLLSVSQLSRAHFFSDNSAIAVHYKPDAVEPHFGERKNTANCLLLIDKQSGSCKLFDDEDCIALSENEQACVDTSHNVLWSLNATSWTATSYLLSGFCPEATGSDKMFPFSPELAISLVPGSLVTRTQAGLNLLSCIDTLVSRCPNGVQVVRDEDRSTDRASSARRKPAEQHTADEYSIVNRFKSHGGGWGYSVHSTEAIRFMADSDILLGGIGVFGGRGEYSVIVSIFEEAGESDGQGEGELLVETDRIPYECGFREKFRAIFDEPVSIQAGQWYTVTAKINGPSSDCGSHGEQSVTTSDNIKFSFRRSKRSNNGTDVSAGQIPELLYTLPVLTAPAEKSTPFQPSHVQPVQIASKEFYLNFSENILDTLPYVLECSRTALFLDVGKKSARYLGSETEVVPPEEELASHVIRNLAYVFASCLRLLRVAVTQNVPAIGREYGSTINTGELISLIETMLTDGELDAAVEDAMQMPLSDRNLVTNSAVSMVTECHMIITECMDMLHPSPPKKWNYLHQALEIYNTSAAEHKPRASRLLVSVLDALCQRSINLVQCLPLFPRTFSNLASIASTAQSPNLDADLPVAGETPTMSSAAGFYEVANLLVEISCSPARALVNLEKQRAVVSQQSCAVVDNSYSSFLLQPAETLVTSACKFLVWLASDLAYKASDNSVSSSAASAHKQSYHVVNRFSRHCNDCSWNTDSDSPDAVSFSVDASGVHIVGFGVFGGGKEEHKYRLELLELVISKGSNDRVRWESLDSVKGVYTPRDCDADHIAHIKLNRTVLLKKNQMYAVCLHNNGENTFSGEQGKTSIKGDDGTTFVFSNWHGSQCSNGSSVLRGQIPAILYRRNSSDDASTPESPGDQWVGTTTTPAKAGQAYQRHALNILALVTEAAVEIFNSVSCVDDDDLVIEVKDEVISYDLEDQLGDDGESASAPGGGELSKVKSELNEKISTCARKVLASELVSSLLPKLFADIGVLVRNNPHCAVEVMDLVRDVLPPLISVQQLANREPPEQEESMKSYTVVVESSHPYKPASVNQYQATFPDSVKWMVLEFSSKCQTSQAEDFLRILLVDPGGKSKASPNQATVNNVKAPLINGGHQVLQKMHQDKNWPQKAVLLPGRKIIFSLETASDYTNNKDMKPSLFYGFRCVVTGYKSPPFTNTSDELVNELINVAGLCAVNLMTVHEQLWEDEAFDSSSVPANSAHKIEHLKAIESTASVTLEQHASLFLQGLHLNNFPCAAEALSGDLPISDGSKERKFLLDFVTATPDTSGGRLARWLQPDSYVDPKQCMLQLNSKSLFQTLPTSITIITRDQYSAPVYVPTLKVELSAKPQPPSQYMFHDSGTSYDISPSEPSPTFEVQYEPTKHRDSRYHSVSMMRSYKKYSFEELRYAYPLKRTLKTENVLVASVGNGIYRATWIPSHATSYVLQVTLDQQLKGPRQVVDVADAPRGSTERPQKPVMVPTIKSTTSRLLKFATKNSKGLRIRSNPTLQSPQVGLLEFGDVIESIGETKNSDGDWVKLSEASIKNFCKSIRFPEAWCISHHQHNRRTFLVPAESAPKADCEVDHTNEPDDCGQEVIESDVALFSSSFVKSPSVFSPLPDNHSKSFATPFAVAPVIKDNFDWKKLKIPGVYVVVKCGSAGHNIRYKPSLKAPPIGKLSPGSAFAATSVVKNKRGVWLAIHKPDVAKFCEEVPDGNHAWALAVASDGTQYLQSSEKQSKRSLAYPATRSPSQPAQTNMNSLISKESSSPLALRGALLAKLTNPFNSAPCGNTDSEVVDLLVASHASVAADLTESTFPEKQPLSASREPMVLRKALLQAKMMGHRRSSSDSGLKGHHRLNSDSSDQFEARTSANGKNAGAQPNSIDAVLDAKSRASEPSGRGRAGGPSSRASPITRSHSSPSARRSSKARRSESALAEHNSSLHTGKAPAPMNSSGTAKDQGAKKKSKSRASTSADRPRTGSAAGHGAKNPPFKKQQAPRKTEVTSTGATEAAPPPDKIIRGGQGSRKNSSKHDDPVAKSVMEPLAESKSDVAVALKTANVIPFIDDVVDVEGNILSPNEGGETADALNNAFVEPEDPSAPVATQKTSCPTTSKTADSSSSATFSNRQHFAEKLKKKFLAGPNRLKLSNPATDALSPLVAESSRAVFAAFLWHEGIAHDAMACASFLKFNGTRRSQIMKFVRQGKFEDEEQGKSSATPDSPRDGEEMLDSHPPDTLVYLAMFWDKLSETVTKIAVRNQNLPPPTPVNHNLNSSKSTPVSKATKRTNSDLTANGYNDPEVMVRVPPLKRRAHHRHYLPQLAQARKNNQGQMFIPYLPNAQRQQQPAAEGGDHFKDTMCDLCDKVCPYPVTYHMKQAHPGCGKFAGGLGYNSSGYYCGGWAGDCGDGGVGGSTWYLLCVPCREKYKFDKLTSGSATKTTEARLNSGGDWKKILHRVLMQPANAHQIMKNNSMFLLDLVSAASSSPDIGQLGRCKNSDHVDPWTEGAANAESRHDLWDNSDLLPQSSYSHCSFPSIACSYLHGRGTPKRTATADEKSRNAKGSAEFRNRSLSSQPAPSSGQFKSMLRRMSITPDASLQKRSDTEMFHRRNRIMRSVSAGPHPNDQRLSLNNNEDLSLAASTGSYLLHNPSPSMLKLMTSHENNNFVADVIARSNVLAFVMQRHDLKSLHVTLQMTLRRAALRVYVLQALTWLLRTVVSVTNIHDILWYFVSALAATNVTDSKNESKTSDAGGESTDEDVEETKALCQHPVKRMALAGIDSMKPLVEAFHGFLQTVSDVMMFLPSNSPVQLMAIRCWSLRVLPSDHRFLHESQVFSHISQILSKVDLNTDPDASQPKKLVKVKAKSNGYVPVAGENASNQAMVSVSQDLTSKTHVSTSSHASIANSLTDGSTETFWESGDEDKNKPKSITVDFFRDKDGSRKGGQYIHAEQCYVHIDNTRDVQKKVNSITFWTLGETIDWKKGNTVEINAQFAGWIQFTIPSIATCFKVELRGPDNGLRVRQIKVLGFSLSDGVKYQQQLPSRVLQAQTCEAELLKVFKLLTAEVFGQLLSEDAASDTSVVTQVPADPSPDGAREDAVVSTSSPSPREVDPNLREHMVGILFSRSKLTSLQKKVFEHTVQAIHTETSRTRKSWETTLDATSSSASQSRMIANDSYCFELLSMILALTGSDVGRHYVAQQSALVQDFIVLLHTGSPRMKRQVTLLLRRILREVTPGRLASILKARVPTQYKLADSDSETSSSLSVSESTDEKASPTMSVLDPFFACIAKSLNVQVKRATTTEPKPVAITGEGDAASSLKATKRTQSITMSAVFPGRPDDDLPTWWMYGNMEDKSIVEAVMKLLTDMSENQISPAWCNVAKCAVSEAILSLTKLTDHEREADSCLSNLIMWRALAALCVVDRDHVDKLSSAESCQTKNQSSKQRFLEFLNEMTILMGFPLKRATNYELRLPLVSQSEWWRIMSEQHSKTAQEVDLGQMAPSIQLHRYLALQDKERTHIYTFLVENPQDISSFDVRSREFQFAGHRWYVYTGKPNNEYFSFYLRIVNLGKDVRVHTVYSFNVVNLVNYQNNYTYHSPPAGRTFSRDEDALSWGWKEFIRRETLLKPNGGFIFESNKVLIELECKSYKTVFEESIQLPKVTVENPFPMIHTSPFSVGGFAWQIRIFPDGPDEENKGNVALFLHCTTSDHLAKVKAKFLIEGQQSPTVYEHTFPPNSISEMPSGVAFPSKSEFMSSLKDNKIKVGIEFLSVFEVNEVHVTLSEPDMYPTVCVTPFEDLDGCPWVLKTLQANKLKLKMDQNDKTTSGLQEFYHRHVMWNATLVSPGTEDISLNVPLNTKGSMIGYFGENWSDADVIKTDLSVEDLALSDNPYRTDVDDGYDRYSYVSIHVEIVSNHLLYKTPAPSPTGDRERKLLYNARKDRTQLHGKYQELLRQKAFFESKCQNLTRERTRLIGVPEEESGGNSVAQIEPDFSKFLLDVLNDLSLMGASKGKLLEGRQGRPFKSPTQPTDSERLAQFARYREDISLLVADAQPDLTELASIECEVEAFKATLVTFLQAKTALRITDIATTGSLGTKTTCSNRWDVDLVLLSADIPRNGHCMWMPSFVVALTKMLEEGSREGKLPNTGNFTHTTHSVQFDLRGKVQVDLYPSYDWEQEEGFDALYDELLKQRTSENLTWFCPSAATRQKEFIEEQPAQVKDLIKVVKYWSNAADWNEQRWRPSSYLLSLLLVRAYENACHIIEGSLPSNRTVLKCFVKLVLSTGTARPAPIRICWGRFYDPNDFNIEYSSVSAGECPPIVQDPANPANNVAERPLSWHPFRQLLETWAHLLGMMEEGTMLPIAPGHKKKLTCENHDDDTTPAIIQCNECGSLCSECDRYLHLHRRTRAHQRQVFKEEEEAIRVDLHEGCGRIKLFWFMALADSHTLKAMVEFKDRTTGQRQQFSTDVCRFCENPVDSDMLGINNLCNDPACQTYATNACSKTHPCGHLCGGVKNEKTCLQCLHSSCNPSLNQDADDMCMVCFTDALSAAPAIQLKCGHVFHYHCCETQLEKQWAGPRITFGFMLCSICKNEISHDALEKYLRPLRDLLAEVKKKALQRLEYEGLKDCESITATGGKFYKNPTGFALNKYAYYMCYKCNKAYYGGEVRCDAEADGDLFDPKELICGACSDISCAQICSKHGTDFLEYKCRYCCSVAVYFCFGTTHFCQPCHDDFQRITSLPKNGLPHCPAGPKARQLEGKECPLHVEHPPTGEEFALGCGVCRNAHTF